MVCTTVRPFLSASSPKKLTSHGDAGKICSMKKRYVIFQLHRAISSSFGLMGVVGRMRGVVEKSDSRSSNRFRRPVHSNRHFVVNVS